MCIRSAKSDPWQVDVMWLELVWRRALAHPSPAVCPKPNLFHIVTTSSSIHPCPNLLAGHACLAVLHTLQSDKLLQFGAVMSVALTSCGGVRLSACPVCLMTAGLSSVCCTCNKIVCSSSHDKPLICFLWFTAAFPSHPF